MVGLTGRGYCNQQSIRSSSPRTGIVEWAEQGWNVSARDYYHYASQATVLAPVDWLLALEQPGSGRGLFSAPEYLETFRFIHDYPSPRNRLGLPIGLTVAPSGAPAAGTVGLTCAAWHTGELRYQGRKLRIDGGQSMLNTGSFGGALALAMIQTYGASASWTRIDPGFQVVASQVTSRVPVAAPALFRLVKEGRRPGARPGRPRRSRSTLESR